MQARTGSSGVLADETNGLLGRQIPSAPARGGLGKRDWSLGKFSNILFFFILLGCGVLLGVVASLHAMGYFQGSVFSDHCPSRTVPFMAAYTPPQGWLTTGGVHHSMTDEELLWRASLAPQREGMPIPRIPRIAFLFLTKGPLPLAPLWERYFRGYRDRFSIYVHALPGFRLEVPFTSVFYRRQIPSKETHWGEISMIDAERRLLANALLDFSNERFILVSESCIPLSNFTTFYDFIMSSTSSFVGAFDDLGVFGRGRWTSGMEPEVRLEQWRKGAQWFEVKRKHAIYIVSDVKYYVKFRDFCVPNCYVDEHYIPTMMSIEFDNEITHTSMTSVDWSRGGSHPATFNVHDISDELLQRILDDRQCLLTGEPEHPCYFFARKFSPNTLAPLVDRQARLMGFN